MSIEEKIKYNIDEYLEFDSNDIFKNGKVSNLEVFNRNPSQCIRIFGGAVRDSISGDKINDIDILTGPVSCGKIESFLESIGWKYMDNLLPKDLGSIYNDIHIITEPRTWMSSNRKIIQLIRPSVPIEKKNPNTDRHDIYYEGFKNLISNVDISACGVSWDGVNIHEDYKGAIIHCQNKVFSVNDNAKMYSSKRIYYRTGKLENRGWKKIESSVEIDRDLKLGKLC
jgi:hypothetical protein